MSLPTISAVLRPGRISQLIRGLTFLRINNTERQSLHSSSVVLPSSSHLCGLRTFNRSSERITLNSSFFQARTQFHTELLKPKVPSTLGLFKQDVWSEIVKAYPDSKHRDRWAVLCKMWNSLSEEQRNIYKRKRAEKFKEYEANMDYVINNITEEEIKNEELRLKKRAIFEKRKEKKQFGYPKKPLTYFQLFVLDFMMSLPKEEKRPSFVHAAIKAKEKWDELPAEEKEKYITKSKINREIHKTVLEEWEKNMLKLGKAHLIRKSSLKKYWITLEEEQEYN